MSTTHYVQRALTVALYSTTHNGLAGAQYESNLDTPPRIQRPVPLHPPKDSLNRTLQTKS